MIIETQKLQTEPLEAALPKSIEPRRETIKEAFERFKKSAKFMGYSESTRESYARNINYFQQSCENQGIIYPVGISNEVIGDWRRGLSEQGFSPKSVPSKITGVFAFQDWLIDEKSSQNDPNDSRILTPEKTNALVSKAKNSRDASLLLIPLYTGAAIEEVLELKNEDLTRNEDGSFIIQLNGLRRNKVLRIKPRSIIISRSIGIIISDYIKTCGRSLNSYLFSKSYFKKLTPEDVQEILKEYGRMIDIPDISFKDLANTFAANFQGSPRELDETLGIIK